MDNIEVYDFTFERMIKVLIRLHVYADCMYMQAGLSGLHMQ